jgi:hypothetical protein
MDNRSLGKGPYPHTKWLSPAEYEEATDICDRLGRDVALEGIACVRDPHPDWADWKLLTLPDPKNPAHEVIVALPICDGPWGSKEFSAFGWTILKDER